MIYLIDGASSSGKTYLSQKMLEKLHIPYFSVDHLKMSFYRNGQLCTIMDDQTVTDFLFPYLKEMLLTIMENNQHMILEGCYFQSEDWVTFIKKYEQQVKYCCIVFSNDYINYSTIVEHRNVIESRLYEEERTLEELITEHEQKRAFCTENNLPMLEIKKDFLTEIQNWIANEQLNK